MRRHVSAVVLALVGTAVPAAGGGSMAAAGQPTATVGTVEQDAALEMRFNTETGRFRLRYRPDRAITAPTRVFVSPLHYPHGYRVVVPHGVVRRDGRFLLVRPTSDRQVNLKVVARSR